METYNRICIEDYKLVAENGDTLILTRGEEYTTSAESNGKIVVFTNFWVPVPVSLFAGAIKFT